MEYPTRKLPPGIPPTHHTETPDLGESVQNLANRVATTAEALSPTSAPCTSPRMQSEPDEIPLGTRPTQSKSKRSQSAMQIQAEGLAWARAQQSRSASSAREVESILYPSRIVSPRPSNQSKRVKWPDMNSLEGSTPKVDKSKTRARSTMEDLVESIAAASACCGPVPMSDSLPGDVSPSPLETVYEVERNISNHLTVRTDLPVVAEPIGSPSANDPILSFRRKKLSPNGKDGLVVINKSPYNNSGVEARDDISTSDEPDWAPVSRPRQPPPRPKEVPLQIQLRNAALMREDERREHQLHKRRERQKHEKSKISHVSPRTNKGVQDPVLQSLPLELTSVKGRRRSSKDVGSVKSGTTWTPAQDGPKRGPQTKMSSSSSMGIGSIGSGTTWTLEEEGPRGEPPSKMRQHEKSKISHVSPRTNKVVQEPVLQSLPPELTSDKRRRHSSGGVGSNRSGTTWTLEEDGPRLGPPSKIRQHEKSKISHVTPRTNKVVQEPVLQSLPPELTSDKERRRSSRGVGSNISGTTWTLPEEGPRRGYQLKMSSSPRKSGSTWTLQDDPKQSARKVLSPRIKMLSLSRCSPRLSKRSPRKKKQDTQSHFAEINWKYGPATTEENPFAAQKEGKTAQRISASHNGPRSFDVASDAKSETSSRVSEISWKSPHGRKVAKMKKERVKPEHIKVRKESAEPEGVYAVREYEPGQEVKEWEQEVKEVLASPSILEVKSSDSEGIDDRYDRSRRAKQKGNKYKGSL